MALRLINTLDNGVQVRYHRIVSLNIVTNRQNTIEVASYPSAKLRRQDTPDNQEVNVYISTRFYVTPYDQNMSVVSAYEYLKTLPEFEGATDVLEDEDTTETQESDQTA